MNQKIKIRNNICLHCNPPGCINNVKARIEYIKKQPPLSGCNNALIIGSSSGYGLASRILAAFACRATTVGLAYDKHASNNSTGTAGWHNTIAFEQQATKQGIPAYSINGDAFSSEIKNRTIDLIKRQIGKIDLLIYSLASPLRKDPETGVLYKSVIKPIGQVIHARTINLSSERITEKVLIPATEEEIINTVKVMGGEDWLLWIKALKKAGLLATGIKTIAFSYIGPQLIYPYYRKGTIGQAKEHLEATAGLINQHLEKIQGRAFVSVNKALITQASAVIPGIMLYLAILYRVMKQKALHEDCLDQAYRLFHDYLFKNQVPTDKQGRIRLDDLELRNDVQVEVARIWQMVNNDNLLYITDLEGIKNDFYSLFGNLANCINRIDR